MPSLNPGHTQIVKGSWSADCTTSSDLVRNQQKYPEIRKMMERVDKRQLTVLLTSGAVGPYGIDIKKETKFGKIKEGSLIGDNSLRFNVMGRLNRPTTIISQYGASGSDGSFQMIVASDSNNSCYLYKGQVCLFQNANRYSALIIAEPQPVSGGWLVSLKHPQGEVFNYANVVGSASGTPTCIGVTTGVSEKSLKGYGRDQFPDTFIVDMTIQRKTVAISGGAATDILWYEYQSDKGAVKGWKFEKLRQAEATFAMENEYAKIFGISTMKDVNGTRVPNANIIDPETMLPIVMGDGIEEQIANGNEIFGSGPNGEATEDDFNDAIAAVVKSGNTANEGVNIVFMTGYDGYANAQVKMRRYLQVSNQVQQMSVSGGADIEVGYHFTKYNFAGSSVCFVQHPLFDNEDYFGAKGSDGKSLMSSTYIGGDIGAMNSQNIEIIAKGAYGVSRAMVTKELNGLTGFPGETISEEDALKYAMLREDLLVIYRTLSWVIIRKSN